MGKKRRGHYCKECGRYRANEKYNGKGHRQHICKDCQRSRRQGKKKGGYPSNVWDTIYESNENFPFIAGYTEGGVPFGITHDQWDEEEQFESNVYDEQVLITLPTEMAEKLKNISSEKTIEKAIYHSITLSLFMTNEISMERAAYLLNYDFNDFIHFLQTKRIPWCIGEKDGYKEYKQSIDDLLIKIDQIVENVENLHI